ncbi:MAG TPA: lysozyme inhibitor LprI family protein [Polyangiaceae bacterium]
MSGLVQPATAASAEPRTAPARAPLPSALPAPNPPPAAVAPAISASAPKDAPKYPEQPCEQLASDFREYTGCWAEAVEGVRDALDATVLAERKRGTPLNAPLAALLGDQEKWEKKRDARCNAKDNGQMGQGMGSIGQLSVARCRYEADRKRLSAFQAARDKP